MRNHPARVLAATTVVLLAALFATVATAGELVRFVDGRYLEIESHAVHGQAIRLTVGSGGVLVFAADRVEWIERGGQRVLGEGPAETAAGRTRPAGEPVEIVTVAAGRDVRDPDAERPSVREVARDFAREAGPALRPIR
jgi:hypothetical protein